MDKKQYKRLLQMRKSEEEMFYRLIQVTGKTPQELIEMLPINHKRAWYLLSKWADQGKYEYGVSLDLGWTLNKTIQDYEDKRKWISK